MKLEQLARLFAPRRVVFVPALGGDFTWGRATAANLASSTFQGEIYTVNVAENAAGAPGTLVHPEALPDNIDVAVVALPQPYGAATVEFLTAKGCRAIVLVGPAVLETETGRAETEAIRRAARRAGARVFGSSRVGIMVPEIGLNAGSFPRIPRPGPLALITQSDSIATTLIDWAAPRRIGFSRVVSLGEAVDADIGDLMDFLAADRETRGVLLYVCGVTDARRFMSAARVLSRVKPVVVLRPTCGATAPARATTLAGAMMRPSDAFHAAFKRAGMVRIDALEGLLAAAETLSITTAFGMRGLRAGRLAIVSNGSAPAMLAADALVASGGRLAALPAELADKPGRNRAGVLDLGSDAGPEAYRTALEALAASDEVDAALAIRAPSGASDPIATANAVGAAGEDLAKSHRFPVLTAWLGERDAEEARARFLTKGIATYAAPEQAVQAFMVRVRYERARAMLLEIPASIHSEGHPNRERARALAQAALEEGDGRLVGTAALALVEAYGIPGARMLRVSATREVLRAAASVGYPVTLTVRTRARGDKRVRDGFSALAATEAGLRQRLAEARAAGATSGARVNGGRYVLQSVAHDPEAVEIMLGVATDPRFGPVLMFGHGGPQAAAIRDVAFALPPVNAALARQLIAETRIGRLLLERGEGSETQASAVIAAVCDFSRLVVEQDALIEGELNPLWVGREGVRAVAATFRLSATAKRTLAIQPYPAELERTLTLWDGREVQVRPIRPEDAKAHQRAFAASGEEDRRMRYFTSLRELSDEAAARSTQIDYDREMALVAVDPAEPTELLGGARIIADPDNQTAEFAVSVRSAMKGTGLGPLALGMILDYAYDRGIKQVWGTVLRENKPMIAVAERLGFRKERDPDDPECVKMVIDLPRPGGARPKPAPQKRRARKLKPAEEIRELGESAT
ncbi:MAG: GNAT family N-acetyltransferase [Burkholderiales bacterium]|jgi:acetyltransferase|nr:GNAT family N-acetyltransferase [Burkholderiales bacterium]